MTAKRKTFNFRPTSVPNTFEVRKRGKPTGLKIESYNDGKRFRVHTQTGTVGTALVNFGTIVAHPFKVRQIVADLQDHLKSDQ